MTDIQRCVRRTDWAFRYSGEEFTVFMPETEGDQAEVVAERIRAEFAAERFRPVPGREEIKTVSIGIARYRSGEEMKDFINRADRSMYEAKRQGKDRVCTSPGKERISCTSSWTPHRSPSSEPHAERARALSTMPR